jgi:hypothetical protein
MSKQLPPPEPLFASKGNPCTNKTIANGLGNKLPNMRCYIDFTCPNEYTPMILTPKQGGGQGNVCTKVLTKANSLKPATATPICPTGKVLVSMTDNKSVCVKPK